jgi:hypothetical protein
MSNEFLQKRKDERNLNQLVNTTIPANTNGANGEVVITIPAGLSDGTRTCTFVDSNLIAENIKD